MKHKRIQPLIYTALAIALIFGIGLGNCFFVVSAQNTFPDSPKIFLQSDFILWRDNEKMMDSNFTINIVYFGNNTENNTENNTYLIQINNNEYQGTFNNFYSKNFLLKNESVIFNLKISVNEEIIMEETNIILVDGIDASSIIEKPPIDYSNWLNPIEWNKKQWNIFFAIVLSAIFSSFIAYRLVKRYRKTHGT